jgi:hypothetical protein
MHPHPICKRFAVVASAKGGHLTGRREFRPSTGPGGGHAHSPHGKSFPETMWRTLIFFLTSMDSYLLLLAWTICVHEGGAHAERQVRLRFLFLCGKSGAWLMQTLKENLIITNPSQIRVKPVLVIFTIFPPPFQSPCRW